MSSLTFGAFVSGDFDFRRGDVGGDSVEGVYGSVRSP